MNQLKYLTFLIIAFVSFCNIGYSQEHHDCGQHILMDKILVKSPLAANQYQQAVRNTLNAIDGNRNDMVYRMPVVFHILHQGGSENISDAQIIDQVRILNRDYQKQNADTSLIIPVFKPLIANVGFEFGLAQLDPDGNCTDGIIRHYTERTNWDANDFSYFAYSWPREKYLNIYSNLLSKCF